MGFVEYLQLIGALTLIEFCVAFIALGVAGYRFMVAIGVFKRGAFSRFLDESPAPEPSRIDHPLPLVVTVALLLGITLVVIL